MSIDESLSGRTWFASLIIELNVAFVNLRLFSTSHIYTRRIFFTNLGNHSVYSSAKICFPFFHKSKFRTISHIRSDKWNYNSLFYFLLWHHCFRYVAPHNSPLIEFFNNIFFYCYCFFVFCFFIMINDVAVIS
jgi:hypothetical protein